MGADNLLGGNRYCRRDRDIRCLDVPVQCERKLPCLADRPIAVGGDHLADRVGLPLWASLEAEIRATSVSWPEAEELPWRTAFTAFALRLRALASLLLALERRRIASLKAQDYADFQCGITAGIWDRRNGVQGSVCAAAILSR